MIGAKWAHPDRPAIAFVGDGAMQMNGMAELITVAQYWQQWTDPRLIVAVLHNNDLNQVTWEMRAMEGAPKFAESQTLPDVDYAAFARSLGLRGHRTSTTPDEIGRRWERGACRRPPDGARRALRPRRPADPAARHLRAEPSRWSRPCSAATRTPAGFIKQGIKQKVQQYLPGTKRTRAMRATHRHWRRGDGRCHDIRTGRFERTWPALTAAGAAITPAEIYISHDGASFGNKMMWWPIVVVPTAIPAGVAAVFSPRGRRRPCCRWRRRCDRGQRRCRAPTCTVRGISATPGRASTCDTTWRSGPPAFAPLLARWSAAWACWPRCCAARTAGERAS